MDGDAKLRRQQLFLPKMDVPGHRGKRKRPPDAVFRLGRARPRVHPAADGHFKGGVRVLRGAQPRVLRRCFSPEDPAALAKVWQANGTPQQLLAVVAHCAHQPAAVPLDVGGIQWPTGGNQSDVGDYTLTAAHAALLLPKPFYVAVRGIGGLPGQFAADAAAGCPALCHAQRARRPDLYWMVATCQTIIRQKNLAAAVTHAVHTPWKLERRTPSLAALKTAARTAEARFAAGGSDITIGGCGMAVSLRDKAVLLVVLVWGPHAWHSNCPECAPAPIRSLCDIT